MASAARRRVAVVRGNVSGAESAIGNLVADAWHAALAIAHGCDWISDDSDFGRFPDLRWRRPGLRVCVSRVGREP
ncbi:MAG: PIN domain-containing protein [Gemmatimonadetes bacterium]|nr:PIN domain-containing protein [Gemmatimonadota bacterium]